MRQTSERWEIRFFRHRANVAVALSLPLLVAVLVWAGAVAAALPFILAGVLLFPLNEYGLHRFALHAPPSRHPFVRRMQHRLHFDHHADPQRFELLFAPWWFTFPAAALNGVIVLALFHHGSAALGFTLGSLMAMLYYEWVHYVSHVPITPRTRFGQAMKRAHLWHHHKNEHFWFGVTTPVMDKLHGTFPAVREVPMSVSVRALDQEIAQSS
ncbi:MAG TPA: sterol desaturase family protein [Oscillatoriaceae cyanobacterium]